MENNDIICILNYLVGLSKCLMNMPFVPCLLDCRGESKKINILRSGNIISRKQ